jgi:hypothetical protein
MRPRQRLALEGPDHGAIGQRRTGYIRLPGLMDNRCLGDTPKFSNEFDSSLCPGLYGADKTSSKGVQHRDLAFVNQARGQVRKLSAIPAYEL